MTGHRALATLLVCALTTPVGAAPAHVLVLRVEGPADEATRARIDTVVLRLAQHVAGQVTLGDITFGDAEAAVGCNGDVTTCKDEVLSTMAADEIITTTVEPNGPDLQVIVQRATKGAPVRSATVAVAAGDSNDGALERGLSSLFGISVPEPTPPTDQPTTTPPPDRPTTTTPTGSEPTTTAPTPGSTAVTAAPNGIVDTAPDHHTRHQLELIGMASGGVLTVLGLLSWAAANNTQGSINAAPTKTATDLTSLKALEQQGDNQAGFGNFCVVTGVLLGGIATILYVRDRRNHSAPTARLAPVVMDHGAGITLTFGGGL